MDVTELAPGVIAVTLNGRPYIEGATMSYQPAE